MKHWKENILPFRLPSPSPDPAVGARPSCSNQAGYRAAHTLSSCYADGPVLARDLGQQPANLMTTLLGFGSPSSSGWCWAWSSAGRN